jgi:hypothetical protein
MEEHKPTGTLVIGVFDGHGEAGDLVSHYFSDRLCGRLVANSKFKDEKSKDKDLGAVMADEIDRLEKALLSGTSPSPPPSPLPLGMPCRSLARSSRILTPLPSAPPPPPLPCFPLRRREHRH